MYVDETTHLRYVNS